MLKTKQAESHTCLSACVASIFELPLDAVPRFVDGGERWFEDLRTWLDPLGLSAVVIGHRVEGPTIEGFSLLVGKTRSGLDHAVVCADGEVVWDPGLGDGLTPECWLVFTIKDPSKSVNLRERIR